MQSKKKSRCQRYSNARKVIAGIEDIFRRAELLEKQKEFGCALLLRFVPLECLVKIITYELDPSGRWPNSFDGRNKGMKILKGVCSKKYAKLSELKSERAAVAHFGSKVEPVKYQELCQIAQWAVEELQERV